MEVVELNVGGTIYATLLETLEKQTGSLLADLAGRVREGCAHPLDRKGRPFIDRDPVIFRDIIGFLRDENCVLPHDVDLKVLRHEAQYFRLHKLVLRLDGEWSGQAPAPEPAAESPFLERPIVAITERICPSHAVPPEGIKLEELEAVAPIRPEHRLSSRQEGFPSPPPKTRRQDTHAPIREEAMVIDMAPAAAPKTAPPPRPNPRPKSEAQGIKRTRPPVVSAKAAAVRPTKKKSPACAAQPAKHVTTARSDSPPRLQPVERAASPPLPSPLKSPLRSPLGERTNSRLSFMANDPSRLSGLIAPNLQPLATCSVCAKPPTNSGMPPSFKLLCPGGRAFGVCQFEVLLMECKQGVSEICVFVGSLELDPEFWPQPPTPDAAPAPLRLCMRYRFCFGDDWLTTNQRAVKAGVLSAPFNHNKLHKILDWEPHPVEFELCTVV